MSDKLYRSDKIEIRKSPLHGWGVFVTKTIKKDELIEDCYMCPYIQTVERPQERQTIIGGIYWWVNGWHIPGEHEHIGNINVYPIHVKDKSTEDNGDGGIVKLYAVKDIMKGEELQLFYGPILNSKPKILEKINE